MDVPDLLNCRELGGLPLSTGGQTRPASLLRSDSLSRLTPTGLQILIEYGVRTVVDLRWPEEVKMDPYDQLLIGQPIKRIHISLLHNSLIDWRQIQFEPKPKERMNIRVLVNAAEQIGRVFQVIADAPSGAIVFHCNAGKDRTGIISTLLLSLAGVELPAIVRDYTLSEDRLRDTYLADRTDLSPEEIYERLRCPPQQIKTTLQYLDGTYGGVAAYLKSLGLSESELTRIKHRLMGGV